MEYIFKKFLFLFVISNLSSCIYLAKDSTYKGPPKRPDELVSYYNQNDSYIGFSEVFVKKFKRYNVRRIKVQTHVSDITIDFFQNHNKTDSLVFVFPVLGGKNLIENYFAHYFTVSGIDTAIVHRNNDFKDPSKYKILETILKNSVIRDRIAMDLFEKEYKKKQFGSFGISRGAINAAMTAGVDERLKHNVLVLGGTDIVGVFKNSDQPRMKKYINAVTKNHNISKDDFYLELKNSIKTDPKNLAQYIDAKNTLLILATLDKTVPFKYGMKLRKQIGNPRTIFLLAGHYTSLLYTQIVKIFPPDPSLCIFPFDYVELESVNFYKKSFSQSSLFSSLKLLPIRIIQTPGNIIGNIIDLIF